VYLRDSDKYPVTSLGRLIAVILMTVGVGLFGTFTGYMATFLISTNKDDGK
jgi:voltage-gated potassium channel